MSERPWVVVLGFFVILGLMAGFFIYLIRNPQSKTMVVPTQGIPTPQLPKPEEPKPESTPAPAGFSRPAAPEVAETPEFIKDMEDQIKERREKMAAQRQVWLDKQINNLDLATQTREVYRLRSIPELKAAHQALEEGNAFEAMEGFKKTYESDKASPVVKYLCLDYMKDIARKQGDHEAFFELWKTQAKLMEEEDLSTLGFEKEKNMVKFVEEMENLLKLSRNPSELQATIARESKGDPKSVASLEKMYKKDIKVFTSWLNKK